MSLKDPKWDETVVYNTHAGQPMYLNIRLWCSGGDPKEKARHFNIEGHPNADLLMGYVSFIVISISVYLNFL